MHCRDAGQYREAETAKGLLVLRINGPLCFANAEHVKDCMAEHEVPLSPVALELALALEQAGSKFVTNQLSCPKAST